MIIDSFHDIGLTGEAVTYNSVSDVLNVLKTKQKFRILFRPSTIDIKHRYLFYGALSVGNITVFIDEISSWTTHGRMFSGLEELIRMGRHRQVTLIATTHRPADVHKLILSQSDLLFGKLFETNDVRYIRSFYQEAPEVLPRLNEPKIEKGKLIVEFVRPLVSNSPVTIEIPI